MVTEIEQIQKQGQKAQVRTQPPVEAKVIPFEPMTARAPDPVPQAPVEVASPPSRVSLQWSGSVVLDLQFPHSSETLQLRQVGDLIEIRFSDGKAVHIPFKAVA